MSHLKAFASGTDAIDALTVDRATSNGDVITLQKNGSTVGSVGVTADGAYIAGKTDTALFLNDTDDNIYTITTGLNNRDNTTDLGRSNARFKDLYLGGNLYIGGTAAANALDDYEEGTFTPSFISGATGITYTERSGRYTKIGNMVHFQIFLNVNASTTNSGGVQIGGLPFTSFNGQPLPSYSIGYNNNFHGGSHTLTALGNSNTTTISLYQDDGSQLTGSESNFGNDLYISGSYIAA